MLSRQANLAITYGELGNMEKALSMERDVYAGRVKRNGEEHRETLTAANNYAASLINLERYVEAKSLMRRTVPVARRVLGENNDLTLRMRRACARALYRDPDATLNDLREAVTALEDAERIARRVLGGAHPLTRGFEGDLHVMRAALRAAREKPLDEKEDA